MDGMAIAIKYGGEWPARQIVADIVYPAFANWFPATIGGIEVNPVNVIGIQGDGAVAGLGPGATVTIKVKAEAILQFVANTNIIRATFGVARGTGTDLVTGTLQVVPNIVEII